MRLYASGMSDERVQGRLGQRLKAAWAAPRTHGQVWAQATQGGLAIALAWYFPGHESLLASVVAGAALMLFAGSLRSYRLSAYGYPYKQRRP
jgi:hypothetical protein